MTLRLIYIDVVSLAVLLAIILATGILIGWIMWRRRQSSDPSVDPARLIELMARSDHLLTKHIFSILAHLEDMTAASPADLDGWKTSRDDVGQVAHRMARHVHRLTLIRKGETFRLVQSVDLALLIEEIIITLLPAAKDRNVTLRLVAHRLTPPVMGDPEIFEEVFTTLLDNAIKYTPPGTEVVADLSLQSEMVRARISDNGQGMSKELTSVIFLPYERSPIPGGPSGTGMGLCIAQNLIKDYGSEIKVESELGRGSIFSIELPIEPQTG